MNNRFKKLSFTFKKEYKEDFETYFAQNILLQATIEDYDELISEISADPIAFPDNFTLKKGEIRYSFFFDNEKKKKSFLEQLKPQINFPIKIEEEEIKIYLFPKIIDISSRFVVVFEEKKNLIQKYSKIFIDIEKLRKKFKVKRRKCIKSV